MADGPVILLQPRRVAARAIAARIAEERGWTLGREVGWQVRFERRFSAETRLLVVTEGILTARLQHDPLLSDFRTIVLDEFHERSIHADLAIALARQAWRARDDLRIVVMSATIDAQRASSAFLDGCPVIDVPGRLHPVDIALRARAVGRRRRGATCSARPPATCCAFFRARPRSAARSTISRRGWAASVDVVPLHGSLDADEQDAALRPTSSGAPHHRRDQHRRDVADGAGRHGRRRHRAAQGRAVRRRARHRQPRDRAHHRRLRRSARRPRRAPGAGRGAAAVGRARPAAPASRAGDPSRRSVERRRSTSSRGAAIRARSSGSSAPRDEALDAAMALLARLGLIDVRMRAVGGRLTARSASRSAVCRCIRGWRGCWSRRAARAQIARACALLSERHFLPPRAATTTLGPAVGARSLARGAAARATRRRTRLRISDCRLRFRFRNQSAISNPQSAISSEAAFRRAILAGYPDRVAQRREPGSAERAARVRDRRDGRDRRAASATASSSSRSTWSSRRWHQRHRDREAAFRRVRGFGRQPRRTRVADSRPRPRSSIASTRRAGTVRAARSSATTRSCSPSVRVPVDPEIGGRPARRRVDRARPARTRTTACCGGCGSPGNDADLGALVRAAAYGARSLDEVRARPGAAARRRARRRSRRAGDAAGAERPLRCGSSTTTTARCRRR